MLSMKSIVPWSNPSSRTGSYSTGRTSRRLESPMFFIARTVPAMLTGSCGSTRTTWTAARGSSGIVDDDEWEEAVRWLPVATQVDPFAASAAKHELSAPPLPVGSSLVHQQVEPEATTAAGSEPLQRNQH